jgi:AcrR family transcriptional regulator
MPSRSSNSIRRAPQQDRSTRRVEGFLEVAEKLFAEQGFEAATMTQVAERAGSSIGALYSYFPDKKALALALLDAYAAQIERHWKPLFDGIGALSAEEFSERFMDLFLDFVREHPAYLQLQAAPIRLRRSAAAKRAFRVSLAEALRRGGAGLSEERAELATGVVLQMVQGMMQMYADAAPAGKAAAVGEFKTAMRVYVKTLFGE